MESKTTNIYQALLAAQQDMGPLLKNANNPAFRSKYADLSAVIETITEPLHKQGIVFFQAIAVENGQPVLNTTLIKADDPADFILSSAPIVSKDPQDPQKFGAAVTYQRRYSLMALVGLAPEDDDGNLASQGANTPKTHGTTPTQQSATLPPKTSSRPTTASEDDCVDDYTGQVYSDGECDVCGEPVKAKSVFWSNKKYNRTLCWDHQEQAKSGELDDPKESIHTGDTQAELDSLHRTSMEGQ